MSNGEFATDVVACAAITTPKWLPWLHVEFAALVQVLGAIWLFVQITRALIQAYIWWADRKKKKLLHNPRRK